MFEWVPVLHGLYFTYNEFLFIITISVFTTLASILFTVGKILNRPKKRNSNLGGLKSNTPVSSDEDYDNKTDANSSKQEIFPSVTNSETQMLFPKPIPAGTKGGNTCIWLSWLFLSMLPGSFATFQILIPFWLALILGFGIILLRIRYKLKWDKYRLYVSLQVKDKLEAYDRRARIIHNDYKKILLGCVLLHTVLPLLFHNLCVSSYQSYVGPIFGTASLSSELTRFFQLGKACPVGPPCQIYATLPEETATSVFLNVHTNEKYEVISAKFDTQEYYNKYGEMRYSAESTGSIQTEGMENNGVRRVHTLYLNKMEADTMYTIDIVYEGGVQSTVTYRTLPDEHSQRDIIIIQGGDMGNTKASQDITYAAVKKDPDVLVLGGDLAYDNGMCTCYFSWDFFLKDLDHLNKQLGRLVPVIYAIGNHDAGLDEINYRGGLKITNKGPFYMVYFPQHSKTLGNHTILHQVPGLDERKSYHYHKLGKVIMFVLDSGYITDVSEQALWMTSILESHGQYIKIAAYHCPIYYACNDHQMKLHRIVMAQRKEWLNVFDDYKFALAFENHEHYMKRTQALRNDGYDPKGTIYLGNGQWGTYDSKRCKEVNQTGLYDHIEEVNHYWAINVSVANGIISNTPYNERSEQLLYTYEQRLEDYEL